MNKRMHFDVMIVFVYAYLNFACCFAAQQAPIVHLELGSNVPQNLVAIQTLPINLTVSPKIYLEIAILKPFVFLGQHPMIPFWTDFIVCKNNDMKNWSESLYTQERTTPGEKARDALNAMLDVIKEHSTQMVILNRKDQDYQKHSVASCTVSTVYNNRTEICHVAYFSGPVQCSGFQYAVALSQDVSQDAALKMIRDFANNNVRLVQVTGA